MEFKEMAIKDLNFNPFDLMGKKWTLITAGTNNKLNTMTASWGNFGITWGKNTLVTYIRPQRYTREFMENEDLHTVSVYGNEYRKDLSYLGTISGRDEDKIEKSNLTPLEVEGTMAFKEAEMIFVCKKLYCGKINPEEFIEKNIIGKFYPDKDYHYVYISEIIKVLVKE